MRAVLDFVRGAVSEKDFVPILTHFHVYDGRVQGTNGRLTIDAPCDKLAGFNFTVPSKPFLKAIDGCNGDPVLVQEEGKLRISKGTLKVTLPLDTHDNFPRQSVEGEQSIEMAKSVMTELLQLRPFVATDASRPWACGVLFKNGKAFATNNVVLACTPSFNFAGVDFPINLPANLIDELSRVKKEPAYVYASDNNLTFTFADGSWMKAQTLSAEWPDIEKFMPTEVTGVEVSTALVDAVAKVLPFCLDPKCPLIMFGPNGVSTVEGDKSATVSGLDLPVSMYRAENLTAVLKAAKVIDLAAYPRPAGFMGDKGLIGVLVGVRS